MQPPYQLRFSQNRPFETASSELFAMTQLLKDHLLHAPFVEVTSRDLYFRDTERIRIDDAELLKRAAEQIKVRAIEKDCLFGTADVTIYLNGPDLPGIGLATDGRVCFRLRRIAYTLSIDPRFYGALMAAVEATKATANANSIKSDSQSQP
jgi:hypothetical protein